MSHSDAHLESLIQGGHIHSGVYTDPEIFELENTRLFRRAWMLVGHESQIPNTGDYLTALVGREPLIIVRGLDGEIIGHVNRCPHRGSHICQAESGSVRRFSCPYHRWVFKIDGSLENLPLPGDYPDNFEFAEHGLKGVAGVESYRGFIFVCLEPNGRDLKAFLGDAASVMDDMVDRSPSGELELAAPPLRHRYRGNWKMMFENLNDLLHPLFAHASGLGAAKTVFNRVGAEKATPNLAMMSGVPELETVRKLTSFHYPNGHSVTGGVFPATYPEPAMSEYRAAMAAHWGQEKAGRILGVDRHVSLIYPSICVLGRMQSVRIITPLAVDDTEVAFYMFRLKGAPEVVLEQATNYVNMAGSGASPIVADDLEIYERMQVADLSTVSPLSVIRRCEGRRHETAGSDDIHPGTTEAYILNQYEAWLNLMREQPR